MSESRNQKAFREIFGQPMPTLKRSLPTKVEMGLAISALIELGHDRVAEYLFEEMVAIDTAIEARLDGATVAEATKLRRGA